MTVEDLLAVKGVSDPQVSPDGSLVVYVVTRARSGHTEEPQQSLAGAGGRRAAQAIDNRKWHEQPSALEP